MKKLKTSLTTAAITGLVAGALVASQKANATTTADKPVEKAASGKNSCKGKADTTKNSCKSKKSAPKSEGKNGCEGKDGCEGKEDAEGKDSCGKDTCSG